MQQGCAPPEGVGKAPNPFVNSFLNLCRVCPVPTEDKDLLMCLDGWIYGITAAHYLGDLPVGGMAWTDMVNSEYKRNFTWHDGYQATKVDVVRNAPSVPASSEPSLPHKKHYPVQQRSTHLLYDEGGESSDSLEVGHSSLEHDSRARIQDEDLKMPSRAVDDADSRKPEEKQPLMSQSYPPSGGGQESENVNGVPKTTEYRSQFVAWPRPPGESCGSTARKSASMGLIATNKKQDAVDGEAPCGDQRNATADEDDDDAALDAVKRGRMKKTEYKAKFRPFSAYTYVDGSWKKATRLIKERALDDMDIYSSFSYPLLDGELTDGETVSDADRHAWYVEVVERLKKADQYRVRSHAGSSEQGTPEGLAGRAVLSPVTLVSSSARTWKDDRPAKERGRPFVPVHHKKKDTDGVDHPKSREGSTKKKPQVEKTTVRPKSAEPVIPIAKSEHKSPKRTRPKAPKDLPVRGHGDLSGRKKAYKQSAEKSSPVGGKPRSVPRQQRDGEGSKVWLKPDSKEDKEGGEEEAAPKEEEALVNGFGSEEHSEEHSVQPGMTGDDPPQINGEHVVPVMKPPMKVPLTTVKSPEEVTGVRSPDPESWTVPLEIGKGLHWMDGKTPDGVQAKGPPILLSKRLKESSLVGKSQKDIVVCDPGSENTGESVDL